MLHRVEKQGWGYPCAQASGIILGSRRLDLVQDNQVFVETLATQPMLKTLKCSISPLDGQDVSQSCTSLLTFLHCQHPSTGPSRYRRSSHRQNCSPIATHKSRQPLHTLHPPGLSCQDLCNGKHCMCAWLSLEHVPEYPKDLPWFSLQMVACSLARHCCHQKSISFMWGPYLVHKLISIIDKKNRARRRLL